MAKLKPEVIYIRGVHNETENDQAPDIGFPQLELENLFENITIEQIGASDSYDSNKKYVYKDNDKYKPIENEYHFDCIKNGYVSLEPNTEYYTKLGNNYKYHRALPNNSTWEQKLHFSNEIKNTDLFSITPANEKIYIENEGYYNKASNQDYEKITKQTEYSMLNEVIVDWDNDKCTRTSKQIPDPNDPTNNIWVTEWKLGENYCESGHYITIRNINSNYEFTLLNLTFNNGQLPNNVIIPLSANLYKLPNSFTSDTIYFLSTNPNKIIKASVGESKNGFDNNNKKLYNKTGSWFYPNISSPIYNIFIDSNGNQYSYTNDNFPLYTKVLKTEIQKTVINSCTLYMKIAISINYKYKETSNNLQFIFTDKTKNELLATCKLRPIDLNNLYIDKYVHLTNLEYNK